MEKSAARRASGPFVIRLSETGMCLKINYAPYDVYGVL